MVCIRVRIRVSVSFGLGLASLARICGSSGTIGSWNNKVDGSAVMLLQVSNCWQGCSELLVRLLVTKIYILCNFAILLLRHETNGVRFCFGAVSLCFLFLHEISRELLSGFVPNSQGRRVWSLARTSLKVKVNNNICHVITLRSSKFRKLSKCT